MFPGRGAASARLRCGGGSGAAPVRRVLRSGVLLPESASGTAALTRAGAGLTVASRLGTTGRPARKDCRPKP